MLAHQLKKTLEDQFDLICFEDMASLRTLHGSVFNLFRSLHRKAYTSDQRLVFYTEHEPEQLFLDHLQRAATRVDISNWFILLICPYDINQKLLAANEKFGNDSIPIASLVRHLQHTGVWSERGFADPRFLCPLPFAQINLDYTGSVRPCCKFKGSLGEIKHHSPAEIFANRPFQDLRAQMIKGTAPSQCSTCWQVEQQGTTSLRQLMLTKFGDKLDQEWLDLPQIRDFHWAPGTLCNFKCRTCSPWVSTSLASEEILASHDPIYKNQVKSWTVQNNNAEFQDRVIGTIATLHNLEYLHVLGGEPLMWPKLPDLVDALIQSNVASNIVFEINTNCSWFPASIITSIVNNFKAVEIILSIDNTGTRFEIERGGKWQDILHNIHLFAKLRSEKVKINLSPTINLQNVLYLDTVVALAKDLDVGLVWWYLESPQFLSIDNATATMKELVLHKYADHPNVELRRIAQRMANSHGSSGEDFREYVQSLDLRRGQNFKVTHSEAWEAMGGCTETNTVLNSITA